MTDGMKRTLDLLAELDIDRGLRAEIYRQMLKSEGRRPWHKRFWSWLTERVR